MSARLGRALEACGDGRAGGGGGAAPAGVEAVVGGEAVAGVAGDEALEVGVFAVDVAIGVRDAAEGHEIVGAGDRSGVAGGEFLQFASLLLLDASGKLLDERHEALELLEVQ